MIKEAQEILQNMFLSEHIIDNPFFNKKTGRWHVKFVNGIFIRTKDLVEIQSWIDFFNGEDEEYN